MKLFPSAALTALPAGPAFARQDRSGRMIFLRVAID
jgi:hypothetical protein